MRGMRRFAGLLVVAGVATALLAGCTSDRDDAAPSGARQADVAGESGEAVAPGAPEGFDSDGVRTGAVGASGIPDVRDVPLAQLTNRDRKLARTASMSIKVDDVDDAAADARRIAAQAGGYTGSESTQGKSAVLTLTVPGEKLEDVLDELERLGKREERTVDVVDVTDEVVDVQSRILSAQKSVDRARKLFEKARTIADITMIERELAQREAELESLLARQESLAGRVAMAPVTVQLYQDERPEKQDDDDGFLGGLASGWGAFTAAMGWLAQAFGMLLPFLVAVAIPAGVAWWLLRRGRKGAATSAPAPAAPPADAS